MTSFPRGSEWRRWDLHVHTPGTALNDQFGPRGWEAYLEAIEGQTEVRVIGVTDYLTVGNYSVMRRYKEQGRLRNIELLVPNIEFRLAPQTTSGQSLNAHLLISPEEPDHEDRIERAFRALRFQFNGENYSCTPDDLERLGRHFNPQLAERHTAFKEGVNQFKIDASLFFGWLDAEEWLRSNSLLVMAGGRDGLSGLPYNGGWAAARMQISSRCHAIFTSNAGDRSFWLGGTGNEIDLETMRRCNGPKPCLHGSDAHALVTLFEPDGRRYCWIKADPTFEGLRQVLHEPAERVVIDAEHPARHIDSQVIDSISIESDGSGGWFEPAVLPLNAGLVAIIGARGSGKSALAELVACATGSWQGDEGKSFLERAGNYLDGVSVRLRWRNGEETVVSPSDPGGDERARYLSQRFVERLCSEDYDGRELVGEIERVIFNFTPVGDRFGSSSFSSLRDRLTASLRNERSRLRGDMARLIDELVQLKVRHDTLPSKREELAGCQKRRDDLRAEVVSIATGDAAAFAEDLAAREQELSQLQAQAAGIREKLLTADDLMVRIEAFKADAEGFFGEIESMLDTLGILGLEREAFRPRFGPTVDVAIERHREALQTDWNTVQGDDFAYPGTIRGAQRLLDEVKRRASEDRVLRDRIQALQAQITREEEHAARLGDEIAHVEGPEANRRSAIRSEMKAAYVAFFDTLTREQAILEDLYAPVRTEFEELNAAERPIDFSIRWHTSIDDWLENFHALIDGRRHSALPVSLDELEKFAKTELAPAWSGGNRIAVEAAFDALASMFDVESKSPSYLRPSVQPTMLLEWMFELDHTSLRYGLKYNGTDLEKLSPGTKGIVLLILYLVMDRDDRRPLIVDQPEENLDNDSIYKLLVPHFRHAKRDRQIILVTHNPNLVVNTDAEQVVVADCQKQAGLPRIRYSSGALEDNGPQGIRDRVCAILEGGARAFRQRERRYDISEQLSR
ncbi:AAA family ATPase [Microvirga sp. ACRRW]|uniref:TrlF family AAA-like ATPase n=1 Tax=Microvirga sp. ACRRW TaxID=2918205 RepID=UPI001EF6F94B|nr:AAA family ATPase [Microvirga sp. ACRRW]MCG7394261.1 AAA family ATPase [Microvirga sp. ACRRW]